MNGYILMADSYRKAAEQGKIPPDKAEKQARVFDFLGTCDKDDIYTLFNSSAFNEIARGYMRETVTRLIDNGTINEKQGEAIQNTHYMLFDEKTAEEICKEG